MSLESHGGNCLSLSWNAPIVSKHNVVTHLLNMYILVIMRIGMEGVADCFYDQKVCSSIVKNVMTLTFIMIQRMMMLTWRTSNMADL